MHVDVKLRSHSEPSNPNQIITVLWMNSCMLFSNSYVYQYLCHISKSDHFYVQSYLAH